MIRSRAWIAVLCFAPSLAHAQVALTGLNGEDGITFDAMHLLSDLPPLGHAAIELTVKNDTPRERRWILRTRATRGWGSRDVALFERTLDVPPNASRTFEILAPLPGVSDRVGQMDLTLILEGYGVLDGQAYLSSRIPTGYETPRPIVGLSARLDGKRREPAQVGSGPFSSIVLDPARLPSDWRGLVGLDAIWLLPEDVPDISDEGHRTLTDWVIQGGQLFVCSSPSPEPIAPPYGLRVPARDFGPYGFGAMRTLDWDGVNLTETVTVAANSIPVRDRLEREQSGFQTKIGREVVDRPLMLSFLLLFGVVIGPVNLFWFARRDRRARLLWTTPLISVVSSGLLAILILVQDGVGGSGLRHSVTLLMPDQSSEVLFQEQIARTGVLLSSSFPEEPSSFVEPIHLDSGFGTRTVALMRERHSGDWFITRSVQAQRIELVRGSRSRLELLGLEGGPPRVASSLPVTLAQLFYVDDAGAVWTAEDVHPGDQTTLSPAEDGAFLKFFHEIQSMQTAFLRSLIDGQRGRTSYFFASAVVPVALDTLPAIRWEDGKSLFLGPLREKEVP